MTRRFDSARFGQFVPPGSSLTAVALLLLAATSAWSQAPPQAGGTRTVTKQLREPPYYRGAVVRGALEARLPVALSLPPGTPESWLPVSALERLRSDMDDWLASHGGFPVLPLEVGGPKIAAPAVYMGCWLDSMVDECSEQDRYNILAETTGTAEWRRRASDASATLGADRTLVLTLQIAPHWIRQRSLKGSKEVRLGTGYTQKLPWLTSLGTPVWVVQVTGAVVDDEGAVLRSGGEGIWALRTPFRASSLGAQKLLSDEDVEEIRLHSRRDDLPGAPRVWEVALQQLVFQLLQAET